MKRMWAALALGVLALGSAPHAVADPNDPSTWPEVDASEYTTPDQPGWVFFRARSEQGTGCGMGPDGTVGCDIYVPRNADGTAVDEGPKGPPGFYACNPPSGGDYYCPLPPPGTNQVVASPLEPAHYVASETSSFTRDVKALPEGYRLTNGNAWCYVSPASPGGISCRTGANGFLWSSWGGIIGGLS